MIGQVEPGHSRPGRADSRSGHVGFPLIATEFCVAEKFRDVPKLPTTFQH